jgi:hypothetical protein
MPPPLTLSPTALLATIPPVAMPAPGAMAASIPLLVVQATPNNLAERNPAGDEPDLIRAGLGNPLGDDSIGVEPPTSGTRA